VLHLLFISTTKLPHHPHHSYYPPQLRLRIPSGSSQSPRSYHIPYYSLTHNESFNVHGAEYPCYLLSIPATSLSKLPFYGSNSTPSSTPTGSMVGLGHSETNIRVSTNEGDVEEVLGDNIGGAKKWTVVEDQRLIRAWVNVGTNAVVGADQKKYSFWARVASNFNEHHPQGALAHTVKTCNSRWFWCSPIVNKWRGIMLEMEHNNHSG